MVVRNSIVIHVDEGWHRDEPGHLGSDADTKIMTTPEFREALIGRNLAAPVDEGEAVDSSFIRAPTRSLVCEDPEDLRSFEQSTPIILCKSLSIFPLISLSIVHGGNIFSILIDNRQ